MTVSNSDDKTDSIRHKHQIIVINMFKNWNHRYYSQYRIIKYVGFESILYNINLNVTLFFKVFTKFDYMFLSNILLI